MEPKTYIIGRTLVEDLLDALDDCLHMSDSSYISDDVIDVRKRLEHVIETQDRKAS